MKIENMLQWFSCISFLFKPPWLLKSSRLQMFFKTSTCSSTLLERDPNSGVLLWNLWKSLGTPLFTEHHWWLLLVTVRISINKGANPLRMETLVLKNYTEKLISTLLSKEIKVFLVKQVRIWHLRKYS